ncbi:cytochrome c oxidase subunit 6B2 isoform X1 [Pan troglodytes]|uniref:cytochrome c oxidase subunit 6B2 isoform X1 n=1 Tax=Pan troglodytes TaxID=9598 RepID=UPI00051208FA
MLDVEAQEPPKGKWSTPPFDPRFPSQNQIRNCYQNFLSETCSARLPPLPQDQDPPREEHAALRVLFPRVPLAVPHQLGGELERADQERDFRRQNLTAPARLPLKMQ